MVDASAALVSPIVRVRDDAHTHAFFGSVPAGTTCQVLSTVLYMTSHRNIQRRVAWIMFLEKGFLALVF